MKINSLLKISTFILCFLSISNGWSMDKEATVSSLELDCNSKSGRTEYLKKWEENAIVDDMNPVIREIFLLHGFQDDFILGNKKNVIISTLTLKAIFERDNRSFSRNGTTFIADTVLYNGNDIRDIPLEGYALCIYSDQYQGWLIYSRECFLVQSCKIPQWRPINQYFISQSYDNRPSDFQKIYEIANIYSKFEKKIDNIKKDLKRKEENYKLTSLEEILFFVIDTDLYCRYLTTKNFYNELMNKKFRDGNWESDKELTERTLSQLKPELDRKLHRVEQGIMNLNLESSPYQELKVQREKAKKLYKKLCQGLLFRPDHTKYCGKIDTLYQNFLETESTVERLKQESYRFIKENNLDANF